MEKTLNQNEEPQKNKKGIIDWLKKNYCVVIPLTLLVVLISIIAFYQVKINTLQSNWIIEKDKLKEEFKQKENIIITKFQNNIDSLNTDNLKHLTTVFSWSIRAELLRGNKEQADILMNQFIKTPGVMEINLIDPENYTIILSTNKKEEGERFKEISAINNIEKAKSKNLIILPVSGINETIAYLSVKYQF
tara:strand:+ start:71969 stop:72541 length:573 start_codon:yes stop_codon:yes gene_type:complete